MTNFADNRGQIQNGRLVTILFQFCSLSRNPCMIGRVIQSNMEMETGNGRDAGKKTVLNLSLPFALTFALELQAWYKSLFCDAELTKYYSDDSCTYCDTRLLTLR